MAKNKNIELVALVCPDCNRWNYFVPKTRKTKEKIAKFAVNKYCGFDRKVTKHTEHRMPNTSPKAR